MPDRQSVIRRLLDERGLRYNHFCDALGIAPYTFSRIENGVQRPPADYYERAARYFAIPDDLFVKMVEEAADAPVVEVAS
jgi:transcriptional regulator with XRE-family HTH domain